MKYCSFRFVWIAAILGVMLPATAKASEFIESCANNDDYVITTTTHGDAEQDTVINEYSCDEIRFYETLRRDLCTREDVHLNCPVSCGLCCVDDPTYFISLPSGSDEPCSYLDRETLKQEWCNSVSNGKLVRSACQRSCRVCRRYVSVSPSAAPTMTATLSPSSAPSLSPSTLPTISLSPSTDPSPSPSSIPTTSSIPSNAPIPVPSSLPTASPSSKPSSLPSHEPTEFPTTLPTFKPSVEPSLIPSDEPSTSSLPSTMPTPRPTKEPTNQPTLSPSKSPTDYPSASPTDPPTDMPTSPVKPNLLIVMTDEHNLRTISAYRDHLLTKHDIEHVDVWGDGVYSKTHWIDTLAKEGALYSNFYSVAPLCTPSRASFMTGMYPQFVGAEFNHRPMDSNFKTFADILRDQRGYRTGYMGKWHLDGGAKPGWGDNGRDFGFDYNTYRFNRGHWKYFVETNGSVQEYKSHSQFDSDVDGSASKHFATDFLVDRGIEFIQAAVSDNEPFALMISIPDPHSPNEVRRPFSTQFENEYFKYPKTATANLKADPASPVWNYLNRDDYPFNDVDKYVQDYEAGSFWQNQLQQYFGMVANIDYNMGKLLYEIRAAGQEDNTIVIFTSDHGDLLGEHGKINKGKPYETSAGIPFLIKYPDKIQAGKVVETPYSTVDFAPTLLSLMNIKDLSQLTFQGVDGSEELLNSSLVSKNDDKIIFTMDTGNTPTWAAAVKDGHKFIVSSGSKPYLFDVNIDPDELINYIDSPNHAVVKAELQAALGEALVIYDIPMTRNDDDIYLEIPACFDSSDVLQLRNGQKVLCKDMGNNAFTNDCGDWNVNRHCPKTCGTCKCEDSVGPIFVGGEVKTCENLADQCTSSWNVRDFCRKTCSTCT